MRTFSTRRKRKRRTTHMKRVEIKTDRLWCYPSLFLCGCRPVTRQCATEGKRSDKAQVELYSVASRSKVAIDSNNSITTIQWIDRADYYLQFESMGTKYEGKMYRVLRTMSNPKLYLGINAAGEVVLQHQEDTAIYFTHTTNVSLCDSGPRRRTTSWKCRNTVSGFSVSHTTPKAEFDARTGTKTYYLASSPRQGIHTKRSRLGTADHRANQDFIRNNPTVQFMVCGTWHNRQSNCWWTPRSSL